MSLPRCACLAVLLALVSQPGAALAQEVIAAGPDGAPPVVDGGADSTALPNAVSADPDSSPEAIGRWAKDVIAGRPTASAEAPESPPQKASSTCAQPADRKPHGQVWAEVGTGGYRRVGGVVTQPIGECASVTVAVEKAEGGGFRRRR